MKRGNPQDDSFFSKTRGGRWVCTRGTQGGSAGSLELEKAVFAVFFGPDLALLIKVCRLNLELINISLLGSIRYLACCFLGHESALWSNRKPRHHSVSSQIPARSSLPPPQALPHPLATPRPTLRHESWTLRRAPPFAHLPNSLPPVHAARWPPAGGADTKIKAIKPKDTDPKPKPIKTFLKNTFIILSVFKLKPQKKKAKPKARRLIGRPIVDIGEKEPCEVHMPWGYDLRVREVLLLFLSSHQLPGDVFLC